MKRTHHCFRCRRHDRPVRQMQRAGGRLYNVCFRCEKELENKRGKQPEIPKPPSLAR